MKRRSFIKKTTLASVGFGLVDLNPLVGNRPSARNNFSVNGSRLENRILELAKFGRNVNGQGYRVAFSSGDIEGRAWLFELMKNAGLETRRDEAGNIIGRRKGKNNSFKPIAFGSHIDMVPDGGNYDGTLGSLSALEAIEVLNEQKIITNHPLEVIVFADEEGSMVGSKAIAGLIDPGMLTQISHAGLTISEGVRSIGGNPDLIANCKRNKGDIHAFLELHIEQGGILEFENLQVGVVEGIVGIDHWEVTVEGFANHAGTTPMNIRQDALLAASKLVIAVNEVITGVKGSHVGTIGKIEAFPGAYNVIPGKVMMGLELRDLSTEKIELLFRNIEKRAETIEHNSKTKITFVRQPSVSKPALTEKSLQQLINKSALGLSLTTKFMQSGAGHDSQNIAQIAPVAMIFVPSVGGISHSPKEFTNTADMTNGANVLLQTILAVDRT
ncbi:MAG: Zn-dependent hydrolase [Chitinophagaceae bacterium]|nr:Zn-dependent hydrolase [Chitinophagaceae bacterium]